MERRKFLKKLGIGSAAVAGTAIVGKSLMDVPEKETPELVEEVKHIDGKKHFHDDFFENDHGVSVENDFDHTKKNWLGNGWFREKSNIHLYTGHASMKEFEEALSALSKNG